MMADIDLEAVRRRADAAEPGPWRVVEVHGRDIADEGYSRVWVESEARARVEIAEMLGDDEIGDVTAEFIAAAREDVPALLALVDELRAALGEIARHCRCQADGCPSRVARDALAGGDPR